MNGSQNKPDSAAPSAQDSGPGKQSGMATAWLAVVEVLNEVVPQWIEGRGTAIECAVETIRNLSDSATPQPEQPAIDLEQFRHPVQAWRAFLYAEAKRCESKGAMTIKAYNHAVSLLKKADRLLAIIDGARAEKPAIDKRDTERLDWLLENVSSKEMRDLGIDKFGPCTRADLDDIIDDAKAGTTSGEAP